MFNLQRKRDERPTREQEAATVPLVYIRREHRLGTGMLLREQS